jgi:hypothetical protein
MVMSHCYGFQGFLEPVRKTVRIMGKLILTFVGKTVLASRIIDECQRLPLARTTFFYCRHSDVETSGFLAVARTILAQLAAKNEMLLNLLYKHASDDTNANLVSINTAKDLLSIALQTCDTLQKTYVVIDGLDEYDREDRKEICRWFKEFIRSLPPADLGQVRCLFISQDDGYARKDLFDCSSIQLTASNTHDDIKAYCTMWYQRIEDRFGLLDPKEQNIAEIITARARGMSVQGPWCNIDMYAGMFLYAKLVTWNLHEQPNRKSLLQEIRPDTLPDGLNQV